MERLVVFGCSLSYGHGLPDCFIPPNQHGDKHSNLGWPSIVAKHLNRVCVNKSSPGSSNKRIWNEVINFEYQPNDMVIIQWSFIDRTAIIKVNNIEDIGPWTNHTFYKDMYDENDSLLMSKLFVNHSNMFLLSKKIKLYNIVPGKEELVLLKFNDTTTDHIPVYISKLRTLYPLALDNRHPGTECQEVYSKKILDYLNIPNNMPHHEPYSLYSRLKRHLKFLRDN